MTVSLNFKFIVAFLALMFVMHETHEIVHTTVGRLICGCWGLRDFNVWDLCEGCIEKHPIAISATFAGPVYTFILIWIGAYLLKTNNSVGQKSLGMALIFANLPFARILTAALGGGDEVFGLNKVLGNHTLAWMIGLSAILLLTIYPLYRAYKTIENKRRVGIFFLFLILPFFINLLIVLGGLNTLLNMGVMKDYWILGSPILVTFWTFTVLTIFIFTRKHLYKLSQ